MARRILNLLEGLLNLVTMLIIVVVGVYSGYALWDNQQIYDEAGNVQADMLIYKQKAEEIDVEAMFAELKEINSDVQAWLTLDNTLIDYPVLQGTSNFSYLNTNVYGKFAMAGSIFLDSRNTPNFYDQYNLVHGHHMSERKMFGDLDLYKDKDFFFENRTGTLILEDREYSLRTFAALYCLDMDVTIFEPDRWADDIEEPLNYVNEISLYKDDEMIRRLLEDNKQFEDEKKPQIIVLATCSVESDASRFVLLAEMIPVEETE